MLATLAPAKINWTLEVLGKRPDGYHEITSVMSTVSLRDSLILSPANDWGCWIYAAGVNRAAIDPDRNLVRLAAIELAAAMNRTDDQMALGTWKTAPPFPPGALSVWLSDRPGPLRCLHLMKYIPVAAGLGGGSSDAAATLRLLSHAWVGQPHDTALHLHSLEKVAATFGSDVPFFLRGGTQFASSRGERLEPLPDPAARWVVIATPPITIERKTATLYGLLTPALFTDGSRSRALVAKLSAQGPARIEDADIYNVFESVADAAFTGLDRYRAWVAEAAGSPAHLCGAGPSLFALVPDGEAGYIAARKLRERGLFARAAKILGHERASRVTHT